MNQCKSRVGGFGGTVSAAVFLTAVSAFALEPAEESTSEQVDTSIDNRAASEAPPYEEPASSRQDRKKRRDGTLRELRADDTAAISMGFFLYNIIGIGTGLQAGFYAAPDTLIEGDLLGAAAIFPDLPISASMSVGVRQFLTGSLYIKGAFRYRNLHFSKFLLTGQVNDFDYTAQKDLGLDLAFGNRWQWGSFILGLEWVSLYLPVAILKAESVFENDERVSLDSNATSTRLDVRYLQLQLGASF